MQVRGSGAGLGAHGRAGGWGGGWMGGGRGSPRQIASHAAHQIRLGGYAIRFAAHIFGDLLERMVGQGEN